VVRLAEHMAARLARIEGIVAVYREVSKEDRFIIRRAKQQP
jgi:hypothetical protein